VARIGGDEFVMLLPGTSEEVARECADRLRLEICDKPLLPENARLTISLGVAEASIDQTDVAGLLRLADERLYSAKRSGRNEAVGGKCAPAVEMPASGENRPTRH
jgi:diguanylate cyclase (GGDEF)-like protein